MKQWMPEPLAQGSLSKCQSEARTLCVPIPDKEFEQEEYSQ